MKNRQTFGIMPDSTPVERVVLRRGTISCAIITYGGAVQSLIVPDQWGQPTDIVLGFNNLDAYRTHDKFLGALIGRYANRIGNAQFSLHGQTYSLQTNDGKNHLHGGPDGFDKRVWTVETSTQDTLALSLISPDGDEGYPGELRVRVTYTLTEDSLAIDYEARTNRDTLCNLTNHAYFNLSGHGSGSVNGHIVQIAASFYTPTTADSIPTGEIASVEGTPMDLRNGLPIGARVEEDFDQLKLAGGYDHNWVLDGSEGKLRSVAKAYSPDTGIRMELLTTQPGVQFYSGNYLGGCPAGKGGVHYVRRGGFCLETQAFPDAPHHNNFPTAVLRKEDIYQQKTVYRFGIQIGAHMV